ncbi:MAG: DUF433 domain-containing protein [Cyanobacteriota bacterium]|nr:DUF433 domain-containing protein [Cyanobacteriota bacterium]
MTAIIDIGTLIVRSPNTCGVRAALRMQHRPRIAGTRVSVQRIAVWHKRGLTPEEIRDRFGHLNLAQVHAALTYYYANRDEIEEYLAAEEADYHRFEAEYKAGKL